MRNDTPCSNCRIRRRKCVYRPDSTICERCAKIHLECIPIDDPDLNDDDVENEYNYARLQYWQNQILQLETEMEKLSEAIRQSTIAQQQALPLPSSNLNTPPDFSRSTTPSEYSESVCSASSETSTSVTTMSINDLQQQQTHWELSVVDGRLRLESSIKNLQELYIYSQASLRYLSPFAGLFEKERVYFEPTSASIALAPFRFISRSVAGKPRKRLAITHEPLSCNYRAIIDTLVMEYIKHSNPSVGLIHVPTFLAHYRSLQDPMKCSLTLAICVDAIVSPRIHTNMSPAERRNLAEIFFLKCKDMVYDMPDDPTKKLQISMTITFLQQYLADGLIQYDESRRLATIGYLICKDIEPLYSDRSSTPLVARIMFQRHYIYHQAFIRLCDMVLDDKTDYRFTPIELETAPDEPLITRKYISVYNHFLRFASSSFSAMVMQQINCNVHGVPGELSLDLILQFEPVARQWWADLPDELRPFEDPYSPEALGNIENIQEPTQTLVLAFIHTLTTIFHSCLLHPRHLSNDSGITKDVLEAIQQRAFTTSVRSSEIMIFALRRNLELVTDSLPLPFDFLMQLLHALCNVTATSEVQFPPKVQAAFHKCFAIIDSFLPSGHHVPTSLSLLEVFMRTKKRSPLNMYEEYPLPGYALVADIFDTSLERLRNHFRRTP
ncbi:hypothetical protein BDB00DRAFT_815815 [Zychaea mexicana]|uniref:uncharacterized protein n=1 Tax=Zychaea mexicana TaxID=64656 RepID=UPI0022FEDC71|nr:uncharacterized protein BDB00DRAFT_815815 [Zychaea mexicana]KAI9495089.1 hypothetical protein BDB00DRAFT_815815 [Zychaea mexicana]